MKPNFALNLSAENIALLHRTARGWLEVGVTALDVPDLGDALSYLRRSALGLAPHGISTKLVLPNSQILYLELDAPGPDVGRRRAQIKLGLEGRTPYAVDNLVFDWCGTGSTVQVAVVARETLTEAEKFAAEYRFNPISFVAIPDPGQFAGEPWFGPSDLAASLLPEGEKVERDQDPVTVVARDIGYAAPIGAAPAVAAAKAEPTAAATDPATGPAPESLGKPEPASVAKAPAAAPPAATTDPLVLAAAPAGAPAGIAARDGDLAKLVPVVPPPAPKPAAPGEPLAQPVPPPPAPAPAGDALAPKQAPRPPALAADAPVPPSRHARQAAAATQAASIVADPDKPAAEAPGFSSRRATEGTAPGGDAVKAVDQPAPGLLSARSGSDAPPSPPLRARIEPQTLSASPAAPSGRSSAAPVAPPDTKPHGTAMPATLAALRAKRTEGQSTPLVTAPGIPGFRSRKTKPVAPLPRNAESAASQPPTSDIFATGRAGQRGKPRYLGLILTAVLLLLLALIAAWSTFYIASTNAPDHSLAVTSGTAAVATPEPTAAADDAPSVADEMLADQQDPTALAAADGSGSPDPAAPDSTGALDSAVADLPATPAPIPDPAANGTEVAAVGPAPVAAAQSGAALDPASRSQDEIFLASTDTPPPALDALALPPPDVADALPTPQMPPPPFGTTYQFDSAGLIVATPEGIVTPEGVRVVAGPPPVVPPPRPAVLDLAAQAAAGPAPAPLPDPVGTVTPGAIAIAPGLVTPTLSDPTLANVRPRDRPEGLVPTAPPDAQAGADDGASLAIPAGSRLTSLRPRQRPSALLALGEAARQGTQAASLSASAAVAVEPQAENGPPPVLAGLGVSRRPSPRPEDFSKAVADAVAAAVRPNPQETTPVTPESEGEPEIASAMPTIPTKASVAKQATFVNAISLSQINLIGVYGTASERSALIRQANGHYKKVKVGDKFDGGVVAAITATEVRYQKSGRIITLALPKT